MKKVSMLFFVLVFVIGFTTMGCSSLNKDKGMVAEIQEKSGEVEIIDKDTSYYLQVGDTIEIKFYYNSELNETVMIRSDGMISLQLIDDIKSAGLTPSQLDDIITARYSKIFNRPEVTVIVRGSIQGRIFVGGEVNSPGVFPFVRAMTLPQAIFEAGGPKDTAELRSVILIREGKENKLISRRIDLSRLVSNGGLRTDIDYLFPYDIVYVPKTFIAKVDIFVDQYIIKVLPIRPSIGLWYPLK